MKSLIAIGIQVLFAAYLGTSSIAAQAQLSDVIELFDQHLNVEPVKTGSETVIQSKFTYAFDETLVTQSEVKFNDKGSEDHTSLGIMHEFGNVYARVYFDLHRLDYVDKQDEYDAVRVDVNVGLLSVKHHAEKSQRVYGISVPFDLYATEVDLSFDQILDTESDEKADSYKITSKNEQLSFSAQWISSEDTTQVDLRTEYQAAPCCSLKYTYHDNGVELQRQVISAYAYQEYLLTGEINDYAGSNESARTVSAISLEKVTNVAALKLRYEYDDQHDESAVILKFESTGLL